MRLSLHSPRFPQFGSASAQETPPASPQPAPSSEALLAQRLTEVEALFSKPLINRIVLENLKPDNAVGFSRRRVQVVTHDHQLLELVLESYKSKGPTQIHIMARQRDMVFFSHLSQDWVEADIDQKTVKALTPEIGSQARKFCHDTLLPLILIEPEPI